MMTVVSCSSDDESDNEIVTGPIVAQTGTVGAAVDLGLSVKWADHNVGATTSSDFGNYYGWSDAAGTNSSVNASDYSTGNELNTADLFELYKGAQDKVAKTDTTVIATYDVLEFDKSVVEDGQVVFTTEDGKIAVGTLSYTFAFSGSDAAVYPYSIYGNAQYDPAAKNWGNGWRMPTSAEIRELMTQCTWELGTQNGVKGFTVAGPNGNTIFLPLGGYRLGAGIIDAGNAGFYWSGVYDGTYSFPSPSDQLNGSTGAITVNDCPTGLYLSPTQVSTISTYFYGSVIGQTVRPVQ